MDEKKQDKICEYCEKAKAEGYISAYDVYVCEACYENEHGMLL